MPMKALYQICEKMHMENPAQAFAGEGEREAFMSSGQDGLLTRGGQ